MVRRPFCTWKCSPTATSVGVDISKVLVCHLLQQMGFSKGHKNNFKDRCLMNSVHKPDNNESYNSPKLTFTNI